MYGVSDATIESSPYGIEELPLIPSLPTEGPEVPESVSNPVKNSFEQEPTPDLTFGSGFGGNTSPR
jgi:hypothetical protein